MNPDETKANLITLAVGLFILGALITAGFYTYSFFFPANPEKSSDFQNELQANLDSAKIRAQLAKDKLNQLKQAAEAEKVSNARLQQALSQAQTIISTTDVFFDDAKTDHPTFNISTKDSKIEARISAKRAQLNSALVAWKRALAGANPDVVDANRNMTTREYLVLIQNYLAELQAIVNVLSPESSGLTQEQIDADKAIVAAATADTTKTIATITPLPLITPQIIEDQNNVVDQANADVINLEQQISTSTPKTEDYVPVIDTIDGVQFKRSVPYTVYPEEPHLIQGWPH